MSKVQDKHEAFKNRLVEEVLGSEAGETVPMDKVVMLLWQFRDDPSVITFMARFIGKYAGSRHVFDGIEFYLPQLAHMIIHLEVEWDDAVLERFALVIAQQSLHFALQLNWILQGALEDYQPELPPDVEAEGEAAIGAIPNPNYNPVFYSRCLKLLRNVERCVVYGKPRAAALQRLYEQGKITKREMILMEQADRRFNALQITEEEGDSAEDGFQKLEGWILVQLPIPLSEKSKNPNNIRWMMRFCVLERHVLNCFRSATGCCTGGIELERAMTLERAIVSPDKVVEAADRQLTLHIKTSAYQFRLKLNKPEEAKLWLRRLKEEAETSALFQQKSMPSSSTRASTTSIEPLSQEDKSGESGDIAALEKEFPKGIGEDALKDDLTQDQLERYEFFQNERNFVQSLTDLAEELREHDRDERKQLAPKLVGELDIPTAVYLPLCNSSHTWRRVGKTIPKHTRVFNTKERCPVIIYFVTQRGEYHSRHGKSGAPAVRTDPNLDVAQYMHAYFDVTAPVEEVAESEEEAGVEVQNDTDEDPAMRDSRNGSARPDVWQEEDQEMTPRPSVTRESLQREVSRDNESKGNSRVQKLLRDGTTTLPTKLASRISESEHAARSYSIMDLQTELQESIPILDELARNAEADNASIDENTGVAIERSSVLMTGKIVLGGVDDGGISQEALARAKEVVCGGETFAEKSAKMLEDIMKQSSGKNEYDESVKMEISTCMSKSNDDLRQEVFVMQMIHYYKSVFAKANLPLWLKTYRILSVSSSTGLLEFLVDATSIDGLKKSDKYPTDGGMRKYFENVYGPPSSASFKAAQTNFMQSLAGYAIVSYLLGLKDRHNGNIMIDIRGHLINIDFGFAMGMAPGHEFSMERAPFKFTKEYLEVMGGEGSECYKEFERLFVAGIEAARKNSQIALGLVEIMMFKSNYPCFSGSRYGGGIALTRFQERLMIDVPDNQVKSRALGLISQSKQHMGTYLYDVFQQATNGYAI